jgi:superfamily I DNA/RNA helicase
MMHHLVAGRVGVAVGDDDQAIYGFRRALGYRGMRDFVAATGAHIITLDTNYRSTADIVDAATRLIQRNLDRVQKRPVAARGAGQAPKVIACRDEIAELDFVAEEILKLCAGNKVPRGDEIGGTGAVRVEVGQVAILARTNQQLRPIEQRLQAAAIPYYRMGRSLWDDALVQVYVSLLKSLAGKSATGIEVGLKWAAPGLGKGAMQELLAAVSGDMANFADPAWPELDEAKLAPAVRLLYRQSRRWRHRLDAGGGPAAASAAATAVIHGVFGWMVTVLRQETELALDPEKLSMDRAAAGGPGEWQIKKLRIVCEILEAKPGGLTQRISRAQQQSEEAVARVMLGTFHASKGLEWENVFLIGINHGKVPIPPKSDDGRHELEQEAEERRIFYVAMTRARDRLYLSHLVGEQSEFLVEAGLADERNRPDAPRQGGLEGKRWRIREGQRDAAEAV